MNFTINKPDVAALYLLIFLLNACAQSSHLAPVKTVNQVLQPTIALTPNPTTSPPIDQTEHLIQSKPITPNAGQNATIPTQPDTVTYIPDVSSRFLETATQNGADPPQQSKKTKPDILAIQYSKPFPSQHFVKNGSHKTTITSKNQLLSTINTSYSAPKRNNYPEVLTDFRRPKDTIKKSSISNDNKKVLKLMFQWPLKGKISRNFSQTEHKGILISGKNGQLVHAAEAGKVVYCGRGQTALGNLLIIKHHSNYLSAYAHNSQLTIKEGQKVKKGQTIGVVGSSGLKKSSLHFEIRKNGKPINPLTVLPRL